MKRNVLLLFAFALFALPVSAEDDPKVPPPSCIEGAHIQYDQCLKAGQTGCIQQLRVTLVPCGWLLVTQGSVEIPVNIEHIRFVLGRTEGGSRFRVDRIWLDEIAQSPDELNDLLGTGWAELPLVPLRRVGRVGEFDLQARFGEAGADPSEQAFLGTETVLLRPSSVPYARFASNSEFSLVPILGSRTLLVPLSPAEVLRRLGGQ